MKRMSTPIIIATCVYSTRSKAEAETVVQALRKAQIDCEKCITAGKEEIIGEMVLKVLSPTEELRGNMLAGIGSDIVNKAAIVLHVQIRSHFCGVLTADCPAKVLLLAAADMGFDLDFLNLPHHGAESSFEGCDIPAFVQKFKAKHVLVSTDTTAYGHPTARTAIDAYAQAGAAFHATYSAAVERMPSHTALPMLNAYIYLPSSAIGSSSSAIIS